MYRYPSFSAVQDHRFSFHRADQFPLLPSCAAWQQSFRRRFGAALHILFPHSFRAEGEWFLSEWVHFILLRADGCAVRILPAQWASRKNSVLIAFQMDGSSKIIAANESSLPLRIGEWAMFNDHANCRLLPQIGSRLLLMRIAQPEHSLWPSNATSPTMLLSSRTRDRGKFVRDFVINLHGQVDRISESNYFEVTQALFTLLRLSLSEQLSSLGAAPEVDLNTRIKAYIAARLRDPELSLDEIAAAMGCSKRSLHKAFASEGISISDHLWQARLRQCREQLSRSGARERSITEIALSWGFSSPGHFSTLFKSHFQISPREYRNTALALSAPKPVQRKVLRTFFHNDGNIEACAS